MTDWNIRFNAKLHSPNRNTHWTKRSNSNKRQGEIIVTQYLIDKPNLTLPSHIELIRIAPREYDYDNLVSSFKGIRDTIAQLFFPEKSRGTADNSKELTWAYSQKRGKPKEYAIEINIKGAA